MDWFWSNLLGGIKLCVRESDADAASDLLDLDIPENFDFAGVGEYEQPLLQLSVIRSFLSGIE